MHQGRWINPAQRLGILVQPDILTISGYIHENKREKITLGRAGLFYPDTDFAENFPVRLDKLAENSSDTLHWPELSARFGGAIPTDETPGKTGLTARYGLYAAQFSVEADIKDFAPNPRVVRGWYALKALPKACFGYSGRNWRHSGGGNLLYDTRLTVYKKGKLSLR